MKKVRKRNFLQIVIICKMEKHGWTWLLWMLLFPLFIIGVKTQISNYNQYTEFNEDENVNDNVVLPSLRGDETLYRDADVKKTVEYLNKKNAKGMVIYSAADCIERQASI